MSSVSKVLFITGTSLGFGRQLALEALSRGHRVIAVGRDVSRLSELKKAGAATLQMDVASPLEKIKETTEEAIKIYGRVDIVISNAGYIAQGIIEETTPEETYNQFNVNVFGLINVARSFLPHFRQNRSGIIVNIGSIGAWRKIAGSALYCASKAAVRQISFALDGELKPWGARSILIEPGYFRTEFLNHEDFSSFPEERRIPEYDQVRKGLRQNLGNQNKNQLGDPVKGCRVILDILTGDKEIPSLFLLGSDAFKFYRDTNKQDLELVERSNYIEHLTDCSS